jgi:hypothetical protein
MAINKIFPSIKQPIDKGRNGFFTPCYGKETIRNSIITILLTRLGERVYMPEFGSKLYELVFEQTDHVFQILAREYVFEALARWEPRIEILALITTFQEHTSRITLQYRIRQSVSQETILVLVMDRELGSLEVL